MKRCLLSLITLTSLTSAGALTLTGTLEGNAAPDLRLSGWAVKGSGQPVAELVSAAVKGGSFSLTLPTALPPAAAQSPVDNRISWPGLMDFGSASASAQATEMKFFVYRDANGNGQRDEGETMREVRLNTGRSFVFVVWVSNDVTVTGSNGYAVNLDKGWNALTVDVRSSVSVKPLDPKASITVNTGQ